MCYLYLRQWEYNGNLRGCQNVYYILKDRYFETNNFSKKKLEYI